MTEPDEVVVLKYELAAARRLEIERRLESHPAKPSAHFAIQDQAYWALVVEAEALGLYLRHWEWPVTTARRRMVLDGMYEDAVRKIAADEARQREASRDAGPPKATYTPVVRGAKRVSRRHGPKM